MSKFFTPTKYNNETKNQMWMSMIADGHDICCDCNAPFAHLLDSIFPEGHRDRNKTIQQIIDRDIKECLSGGKEDEDHGMVAGSSAATTEIKREGQEGDTEENIQELLDAVADAEKR